MSKWKKSKLKYLALVPFVTPVLIACSTTIEENIDDQIAQPPVVFKPSSDVEKNKNLTPQPSPNPGIGSSTQVPTQPVSPTPTTISGSNATKQPIPTNPPKVEPKPINPENNSPTTDSETKPNLPAHQQPTKPETPSTSPQQLEPTPVNPENNNPISSTEEPENPTLPPAEEPTDPVTPPSPAPEPTPVPKSEETAIAKNASFAEELKTNSGKDINEAVKEQLNKIVNLFDGDEEGKADEIRKINQIFNIMAKKPHHYWQSNIDRFQNKNSLIFINNNLDVNDENNYLNVDDLNFSTNINDWDFAFPASNENFLIKAFNQHREFFVDMARSHLNPGLQAKFVSKFKSDANSIYPQNRRFIPFDMTLAFVNKFNGVDVSSFSDRFQETMSATIQFGSFWHKNDRNNNHLYDRTKMMLLTNNILLSFFKNYREYLESSDKNDQNLKLKNMIVLLQAYYHGKNAKNIFQQFLGSDRYYNINQMPQQLKIYFSNKEGRYLEPLENQDVNKVYENILQYLNYLTWNEKSQIQTSDFDGVPRASFGYHSYFKWVAGESSSYWREKDKSKYFNLVFLYKLIFNNKNQISDLQIFDYEEESDI
ncbi:hypothetical protein ACW95P_03050 [Candidatus Mycoplasma pogonae]